MGERRRSVVLACKFEMSRNVRGRREGARREHVPYRLRTGIARRDRGSAFTWRLCQAELAKGLIVVVDAGLMRNALSSGIVPQSTPVIS